MADYCDHVGCYNLKPCAAAHEQHIPLGAFSVSLTVQDLEKSQTFYEQMGFKVFFGSLSHHFLVLKNGTTVIGLFKGMFEKNILTFNPGWGADAQKLDSFVDIRDLQKELRARGVEFATQADESTTGPASFTVVDPDGNSILVDQHV